MSTRWLPATLVMVSVWLVGPGRGQDKDDNAAKLVSGPQAGKTLPSPFDVYNINGGQTKDRLHCLVCEYGLEPVVMIFARETEEGKDEGLTTLVQKLEPALEKYKDDYLRAFVVYLSPAGKNSTTEAKIEDPDKLVKEAEERNALHARLQAKAKDLKNVIISYTVAEGPKGYDIHPMAEYTIVFYRNLKVIDNWAFAKDKMMAEDAAAIMTKVETSLREGRKATTPAKKGSKTQAKM